MKTGSSSHEYLTLGYATDKQSAAEQLGLKALVPSSGRHIMTKSVLIVDDSAFIRKALYGLFEREADFEICGEAEDGQQAIAAAMCLHPDLVILDISMPVMNGFDAARLLRTLRPTLPLILYSVDADRALEAQARSVGISEVVSKAAPVSVLLSRARHLLYPAAA